MRKRTQARECALKILYKIEISKDSVEVSIQDLWSRENHEHDIKEFAEAIVQGTCENLVRIDGIISKYTENWEINRMAVIDKNVLRMSIYQILYIKDIPYKVAINEGIDLAKKYGDVDSGKFVNGILDKVREKELI